MSQSAFADAATGFLRVAQVWRPARPVLVLYAALGVGLAARQYGWASPVPVVSLVLCVSMLLGGRTLRRRITRSPVHAAFALELELGGLVLLILNALALMLFGLAVLTANATDKAVAYFVGVLAGASVGYFSKEIFKPTEADSWFAAHYRHAMNQLFAPYFFRRSKGNWVGGEMARWDPGGVESDALVTNRYEDNGNPVIGWNARARRQRDSTLDRGLKQAPWNPSQAS